MSEISQVDRTINLLRAQAKQSKSHARNALIAERFIKQLRPGYNYFTPDQFVVLLDYLYPYPETERTRSEALRTGHHRLGPIELIRVPWLTEDRLVTLPDLSSATGINLRTLQRFVSSINPPVVHRGRKRLYDLDRLRELLDTESGT